MTTVYFAVEGRTDVPVAQRLIRWIGFQPQEAIVAGGKSKLDRRVPALNRSGVRINWLILRDLDHDAPCASLLIDDLLGGVAPSPRVAVRTPVRTTESWLLADREGFAQEFSVSRHRVPHDPDGLDDPKQSLVNTCRRSRKSEIRAAMVPLAGSRRTVGPEYSDRISTFARGVWDPERASKNSPSLQRTIAALRKLVDEGLWA